MRRFLIAILLFTSLVLLIAHSVFARSGCCSHHQGVCGCGCCDGTPLSSTCAPYYPECNNPPPQFPTSAQYVPPPTSTPIPPSPTPTLLPTQVPTLAPTAKAQVLGAEISPTPVPPAGAAATTVTLGLIAGTLYGGYRLGKRAINKLKKIGD